jgi:hypothetical protein
MTRRSTEPARPTAPQFNISLGTGVSGSGASLEAEVELLKPAVLYGDSVTLYSPIAAMLASVANLTTTDEGARIAIMRELLPIVGATPEQLAGLDQWAQLRRKKRRSTPEIQALLRARSLFAPVWDQLGESAEQILEDAGADKIVGAISAGLLTLHPLLETSDDDLFESFLAHLAATVADPSTYPMFDQQVSGLLRAAVDEGKFSPTASGTSRSKQVTAAADFLGRLPNFSAATLDEILDIRTDLSAPLVRFRAAMVTVTAEIDASAIDPDFPGQVNDAWVETVAPAVAELKEMVGENRYLRELCNTASDKASALVAGAAAGGLVGVGLAEATDLPLMLGGLSAAAGTLLSTLWQQKLGSDDIRKHQFFLLHETERRLS